MRAPWVVCAVAIVVVSATTDVQATSESVDKAAEVTTVFACPNSFVDVTAKAERAYTVALTDASARLYIETRECKCSCENKKLCAADGKDNLLFKSMFRAFTVGKADTKSVVSGATAELLRELSQTLHT